LEKESAINRTRRCPGHENGGLTATLRHKLASGALQVRQPSHSEQL